MLDGFDPNAVAAIRARLDGVRDEGVTILFAIESGSRAWGFPSPDSDYDCRFVYLRRIDDHLVLQVQRDVIEFPIEGEIDAGGWDLRKALLLALKGNAVILEWVKSPLVYEEIAGFRSGLLGLLDEIVDPRLVARHYAGLLRRNALGGAEGDVKLKRLFYEIRPVLSLLYMQERDFNALPPMSLGDLAGGIALQADIRDLIESMVATKKKTREMGVGPVPPLLARFLIEMERRFDTLTDQSSAINPARDRERMALAERFYRKTVLEYGAPAGVTAC